MIELRNLKKHEAVQASYVTKEWVDHAMAQLKEEESKKGVVDHHQGEHRGSKEGARGQKEEIKKAEKVAYKLGQAETETSLQSQLKEFCRGYCQEVWAKALNVAEVNSSSELRNPKRIIYLFALKNKGASSSAPRTSSSAPTPLPPIEGGQKESVVEKGIKADKISSLQNPICANGSLECMRIGDGQGLFVCGLFMEAV
nr:hypothetical protein CFP56_14537 [Quercus suber]